MHKTQIISVWFLEHDNEFTLLKLPPQSPVLNPIEHLWDVVEREIHIMDVQPANLQQLRDAVMSIWTKISEECFQHLVESMPQRIEAVLKAKGVEPGTSNVYPIKWPVSVYIYTYIYIFRGGTVHRCYGLVRTLVQGSRFATISVQQEKKRNLLCSVTFQLF